MRSILINNEDRNAPLIATVLNILRRNNRAIKEHVCKSGIIIALQMQKLSLLAYYTIDI